MKKTRPGCSARHANPDIGPATQQGPLMVALVVEGRRVLVVGGGAISARRVRSCFPPAHTCTWWRPN